MTDARLPERWLVYRRLQRLSAEHYRSYINALLYSVANRSDGFIEPEDLGLIPGFAPGTAKALIDAELWSPRSKGWLIVDYAATQSSRDELERLENMRARDREKKQRQRAGKQDSPEQNGAAVPGDGPGDVSPGTAQAGRTAGRKASKGEGSPSLAVVNGDRPAWRGVGPDPFVEHR
jgi:hypothetical protein